MSKILNSEKLLYLLSSLILVSFLSGFLIGENSAGAGGYNGDLQHTWKNLQTFKNNSIIDAIKITGKSNSHLSEDNYFQGTRPPLIYIIQSLNPLIYSKNSFLLNVFLLSIFTYIIFFVVCSVYYKSESKILLISFSCILILSPYFRTSSYWGLEENYAVLTTICTAYFYLKLNNNIFFRKKKYIFLMILFSSLSVYFDQKFIIVPLLCFLLILKKNLSKKEKIFYTFIYILLSIPMFYLITVWGNFIPKVDAIGRNVTTSFYFENIGYVIPLIGFYLFPFCFVQQNFKINLKVNNKVKITVLFYLMYFFFFYDLENEIYLGKGFIFKISELFDNLFVQKIFLCLSIIFGVIIIDNYIKNNKFSLWIIGYLIILSIFIWPFFQEYLDPLLVILILFFSQKRISLNRVNINFILIYFVILLVSSNIYFYYNELNFLKL